MLKAKALCHLSFFAIRMQKSKNTKLFALHFGALANSRVVSGYYWENLMEIPWKSIGNSIPSCCTKNSDESFRRSRSGKRWKLPKVFTILLSFQANLHYFQGIEESSLTPTFSHANSIKIKSPEGVKATNIK